VNHTEIRIERAHEIWALDFEGEEFDERFVIHGEGDIEHLTMNGTMKGIPMKACDDLILCGICAEDVSHQVKPIFEFNYPHHLSVSRAHLRYGRNSITPSRTGMVSL
jgi:hypothetical protein